MSPCPAHSLTTWVGNLPAQSVMQLLRSEWNGLSYAGTPAFRNSAWASPQVLRTDTDPAGITVTEVDPSLASFGRSWSCGEIGMVRRSLSLGTHPPQAITSRRR